MFKAFEEATGDEISQEAKEAATQELVDTAEIGQETGDAAAVAELVKLAKEEIVRRGLDDEESIRQVLVEISARLGLELTDEQLDRLTKVLLKIQGLNLDLDKLQDQLEDFQNRIGEAGERAQGIWHSIKGFFSRIWDAIFG